MVKKRRFPPSYWPVLREIALEGKGEKFSLAKRLRVGYATAHRAITDLHREGLLRILSREKKPSGVIKCTYGLTVQGLIEVLRQGCDDEELRRIVRANHNLVPLVFGEWEFFREAGVEDLALKRLRIFEKIFSDEAGPDAWVLLPPILPSPKAPPAEHFTYLFYHSPPLGMSPEEYNRWLSALSKNKRIADYLDYWWRKLEDFYLEMAEGVRRNRIRFLHAQSSSEKRPPLRGGGEKP